MFDGTINRCLVRIKDPPQVIDVLSPSTYKSRYKKRLNKDKNSTVYTT